MDWEANDEDGQALASIARVLVALAVLAERACGRSLPTRCLILWILRQAEAVARDFVIGEALAVGAMTDLAAPPAEDSVADLMRLATCFRALALAMRKLPRPVRRFAGRQARRYTMLRQLALFVLAMSGALTVAAPRPVDTS
ncbi:MAG TPA: hypothetical protein VMF90_25065 [Rhizobiaceae bacterium]|nr:hypothetical protein [Rhizobiaceae bacterium]